MAEVPKQIFFQKINVFLALEIKIKSPSDKLDFG